MAPKRKSSAKKAANQQPHRQGAAAEKLVNICFCHNGHVFSCQACGEEEISADVMALTVDDEVIMPREDVENRLKLIPCQPCREAALKSLESVSEIFVPYQDKTSENPALEESQPAKSKKKKKANGSTEVVESKPQAENGEVTEADCKAKDAADNSAADQEGVDSTNKPPIPAKREGRWLGRIQSDNPKVLKFKVVSKPKIKESSSSLPLAPTTTPTSEAVESKSEEDELAELSIEPTHVSPAVEIDQAVDMDECLKEWCKLNGNVPKEEVESAFKGFVDNLPPLEPTTISEQMTAAAVRNRKQMRDSEFNSPQVLGFYAKTELDATEPDKNLAFTRDKLLSLRDDLVQQSIKLEEILIESGFTYLVDHRITWFLARSRPLNQLVIQNIQTFLDVISEAQTKAAETAAKVDELVISFLRILVEDQTRGIRAINHAKKMMKRLEDGTFSSIDMLGTNFDEIVRKGVQDVNEREKSAKVLFHAIRAANAKGRANFEKDLKTSGNGEENEPTKIAAKMADYDKKHPEIVWEKAKPMLLSVIVLFLKIRMCRNGLVVLLDHLQLLDSWLCEDLPDAYAEMPYRFPESQRARYCDEVIIPDAVFSSFRVGPAYEFYAAATNLLDPKDPVVLQEFIRPYGDVEIDDEHTQLAIAEHPPPQVLEAKKTSAQNLDAFVREFNDRLRKVVAQFCEATHERRKEWMALLESEVLYTMPAESVKSKDVPRELLSLKLPEMTRGMISLLGAFDVSLEKIAEVLLPNNQDMLCQFLESVLRPQISHREVRTLMIIFVSTTLTENHELAVARENFKQCFDQTKDKSKSAANGELTPFFADKLCYSRELGKNACGMYQFLHVLCINQLALSFVKKDPRFGCAQTLAPEVVQLDAERAAARVISRLIVPHITEAVGMSLLLKDQRAAEAKERKRKEAEEKKKAEERQRKAQEREAEEAKRKQEKREQEEREEQERREREERERREEEAKALREAEERRRQWEEHELLLAERALYDDAPSVKDESNINVERSIRGGRRQPVEKKQQPPKPAVEDASRNAVRQPPTKKAPPPPKPKPVPPKAVVQTRPWNCSRCTFENEPNATQCMICLFERQEIPVEPVMIPELEPNPVEEYQPATSPPVIDESPPPAGLASATSKRVLGLSNATGENSCFLNVVVQSLWHLHSFSKDFMKGHENDHNCSRHAGRSCLVCALRTTFNQLDTAQDSLVSSVNMRQALADAFGGLFNLGEKEDAGEALEHVLNLLHQALTPPEHHQNETDCGCHVHTRMGSTYFEGVECSRCRKSIESGRFDVARFPKQLEYYYRHRLISANVFNSFMRYVPATLVAGLEGDFHQRLNTAMDVEPISCPVCDKKELYVDRLVTKMASIYTVGIVWHSHKAHPDQIKAFLESVSEHIDVRVVEERANPSDGTRPDDKLFALRGMMCYYGSHYAAFFKPAPEVNPDGLWFMFDDSVVRPVSATWRDAAKVCWAARFQPVALFYEADPLLVPWQCSFAGVSLD